MADKDNYKDNDKDNYIAENDNYYVNYWMMTTASRYFITYHITTGFTIETYFMPDD